MRSKTVRASDVHRIPSMSTTSSASMGVACLMTSGALEIRRARLVVRCTRAHRMRYSGSRHSTAADVCDAMAPPRPSRATAITGALCCSSGQRPERSSASMYQPRRIWNSTPARTAAAIRRSVQPFRIRSSRERTRCSRIGSWCGTTASEISAMPHPEHSCRAAEQRSRNRCEAPLRGNPCRTIAPQSGSTSDPAENTGSCRTHRNSAPTPPALGNTPRTRQPRSADPRRAVRGARRARSWASAGGGSLDR